MDQVQNNLANFHPTTLEDINAIKLMKRYDRKFVFHRGKLGAVFDYLIKDYQVLEINGNRAFRYENLYYDTDDYFFYHQHHNRRLNRYKVRCRKYIDSNECYFEIKFKNNKRKTIKTRILLEDRDVSPELAEESKELVRRSVLLNNGNIVDKIRPKLWTKFNRITFANLSNKERLTVDLNLTYIDKNYKSQVFNNLVIAELKSEDYSPNSPFYQYLKNLKIFPGTFSKYCIGIAIMEKDIKCNRFKRKLLNLKKLS